MGTGAKWGKWSGEQDALLRELCEAYGRNGIQWQEISEQFEGRTPQACKQHWLNMRNQAAGKPQRTRIRESEAKPNSRRVRRTREQVVALKQAAMQEPIPPARLPQPKSITAFVFGDPLPGRSALDQMQQEGRRL